jgi:hypothetical protein
VLGGEFVVSRAAEADDVGDKSSKPKNPAQPSGRFACRMRLKEVRNPQVGALVEEFTLLDSTGTPRTLSSLLADGPLLLIFYRGYW